MVASFSKKSSTDIYLVSCATIVTNYIQRSVVNTFLLAEVIVVKCCFDLLFHGFVLYFL